MTRRGAQDPLSERVIFSAYGSAAMVLLGSLSYRSWTELVAIDNGRSLGITTEGWFAWAAATFVLGMLAIALLALAGFLDERAVHRSPARFVAIGALSAAAASLTGAAGIAAAHLMPLLAQIAKAPSLVHLGGRAAHLTISYIAWGLSIVMAGGIFGAVACVALTRARVRRGRHVARVGLS